MLMRYFQQLVQRVHAGSRRTIGTAQVGKTPAVVADLTTMRQKVPGTRVGLRDRAVLLLGSAKSSPSRPQSWQSGPEQDAKKESRQCTP